MHNDPDDTCSIGSINTLVTCDLKWIGQCITVMTTCCVIATLMLTYAVIILTSPAM